MVCAITDQKWVPYISGTRDFYCRYTCNGGQHRLPYLSKKAEKRFKIFCKKAVQRYSVTCSLLRSKAQ